MRSPLARLSWISLAVATTWLGCSGGERRPFYQEADLAEPDDGTGEIPATPGSGVTPVADASTPPTDAAVQACAGTSVVAELAPLPVDIVWVVDNSSSMADEIAAVRAGINAFATQLASSSLDYHLVMLSKRGSAQAGSLWPICVPSPLAGPNCSNGERFFHADFPQEGIKSVQPLEQLLGSLAQTQCYKVGDSGGRGGDPWRDYLREESSKAIVVVSDDNSRLSSTAFLNTNGGSLAQVSGGSSGCQLPPGLKKPYWNGLFEHLVVHAMVGPTGATYTELAGLTGGTVADIAQAGGAQSPAWNAFFETVATQVVAAAQISCSIAIPSAPAGQTLDPARVNVAVSSNLAPGGKHALAQVPGQAACGDGAGWYFDQPSAPTHLELCPASCTEMNAVSDVEQRGADVIFGCETRTVVN